MLSASTTPGSCRQARPTGRLYARSACRPWPGGYYVSGASPRKAGRFSVNTGDVWRTMRGEIGPMSGYAWKRSRRLSRPGKAFCWPMSKDRYALNSIIAIPCRHWTGLSSNCSPSAPGTRKGARIMPKGKGRRKRKILGMECQSDDGKVWSWQVKVLHYTWCQAGQMRLTGHTPKLDVIVLTTAGRETSQKGRTPPNNGGSPSGIGWGSPGILYGNVPYGKASLARFAQRGKYHALVRIGLPLRQG